MKRIAIRPRDDWQAVVEAQGFLFHSVDDEPYWDESACYAFRSDEIDLIEKATYALNDLCLEVVQRVIDERLYRFLDIPEAFAPFIEESWENDEHTIYGRFDFSYDGVQPPKLLEYNADTPTALLEASVIQWFWLQDVIKRGDPLGIDRTRLDQFNGIHERLIEAWKAVKPEIEDTLYFTCVKDHVEDFMTTTYLRDVAVQAGIETEFLTVEQLGWNERRGAFTDLAERPIRFAFKLYPWEWMIRDEFGIQLSRTDTRWWEPPWKMILSNKGILPLLYEAAPRCPYLLRAEFEPFGDTFVVKPILSREGANVSIFRFGRSIAQSEGVYGEGTRVYQAYHPLPEFEGRRPVIGSWTVNGHACGIGIREGEGPITTNTSRFVPHLFEKGKA